MVLSDEEYKILNLNDFDNETLDYSKMFRDHDCCSSHDFVDRWNQLEETFWVDMEALSKDRNTSLSLESSLPEPTCSSTPVKVVEEKKDGSSNSKHPARNKKGKKRKTDSNVSGRQRGILAFERDKNKGLFDNIAFFGGEGWPPPFRQLEKEMRNFLRNETALTENWDYEDASMLRKYFYLKYKIPVRTHAERQIVVYVPQPNYFFLDFFLVQKFISLNPTRQDSDHV